jgi:hypothetical protein
MKRYRLRPQHQRRPSSKDGLNRIPIQGVIFVGSNIVETSADFSKWSAFVEEVIDVGEGYFVADATTAEDLAKGILRIDLEVTPIHPVERYDDDEVEDEDEPGTAPAEATSTVLIEPAKRPKPRSIKERGL